MMLELDVPRLSEIGKLSQGTKMPSRVGGESTKLSFNTISYIHFKKTNRIYPDHT